MGLIGRIVKRTFKIANRVQGLGMSPLDLQRKTLRRLLRKTQFTEFGLAYDFSNILYAADMIRAFQDRVPVFDYDKMHDEWWYRALNNEHNISWPGKI